MYQELLGKCTAKLVAVAVAAVNVACLNSLIPAQIVSHKEHPNLR